jgi:hypothetical protein
MGKTINSSQEQEQFEVTKDCWVNGKLYKKSQLIKLTQSQAQEWLDRKCIKELKQTTKQARNTTSQDIETKMADK